MFEKVFEISGSVWTLTDKAKHELIDYARDLLRKFNANEAVFDIRTGILGERIGEPSAFVSCDVRVKNTISTEIKRKLLTAFNKKYPEVEFSID
jgi:hypothetical protein